MSESMIERVKLEIFQAIAGQPNALITGEAAEKAARAAIAAMREPTEDMLLAAAVEDEVAAEDGNVVEAQWYWRTMIDAALGEQS